MKAFDRLEFEELLAEAHVRPRLREELRFSPDRMSNWPDLDFVAVFTRSRGAGVLIMGEHARKVVSFTLAPLAADAVGRRAPVVCDFCKTWRRGIEAARITFLKATRSSVSYLCCGDLACSAHVRDKTAAARTSRVQLREQITREGRIKRLQDSLSGILADLEKEA